MTDRLRLVGVVGVLPTAFLDSGALDVEGTLALARAHVEAGVSALTVLGVMGEASELGEDERATVLRAVIAAVNVPVIVGVSGASAGIVRARSDEAAAAGAAGLMVSPAASLSVEDAVIAASRAGRPIVLQDYPAGSGVAVSVAAIGRLADREPHLVAVKAEAPPTSGTIAALRKGWPHLDVVGGLGGLFLIEELRAGSTGVMTGFALPDRLVSIVRTFAADPEAAEREWLALLPLMRLEAFQPFGLAARKEVWRLRGVIGSAFCRRAGATLDDAASADIRRSLAAVEG